MEQYHEDLVFLSSVIAMARFDCIVALKRSGFIPGVYLSNMNTLPLFTPSEISSIPQKFKKVLVVDDKVCTGKSIRKVANQVRRAGFICKTVCIYVESEFRPDIYVEDVKEIVKMWYEVRE